MKSIPSAVVLALVCGTAGVANRPHLARSRAFAVGDQGSRGCATGSRFNLHAAEVARAREFEHGFLAGRP